MKLKTNSIINFTLVLHALILSNQLCACYYNYYKKPIDLIAFFSKNSADNKQSGSGFKASNKLKNFKNDVSYRRQTDADDETPLINQMGNLLENNYSPDVQSVLSQKQADDQERVGYWITKIDYTIKVKKDTCDAVYDINVSYLFQKGEFSSIMIKASIDGTVDENIGIQVESETKSVKISETKIVLNCIDPDQKADNPYICIIVIFHRSINARVSSVTAKFNLKFVALGFLRRDSATLNNYFIFSIDNKRRLKAISNVSVTLNIYTNSPIANFIAQPSSFTASRKSEMKNGEKKEYSSYYWNFQEVPGLAIQSIIGMFPEIYKTEKCRQINDSNAGNISFTCVQYLTWTIILGFFGYLVVFISVNEREKYFLYKNLADNKI